MGRIFTPGNGQAPEMPGTLQVSTPFNDLQLVALMAAHLMEHSSDRPAEAVALAIELVAESIIQVQGGALNRAAEAAQARRQP